MRINLAAMVLSMMAASTAFADAPTKPAKSAEAMVTSDCAMATKAGKTCVINIENEQVGGDHVGPGGTGFGVVTFGNAGSLIRLRRDFIPEIVKTAEDL